MTLPAPYPADTRAKGWRFEIDYEKVEQSDTWSLAAEVPLAQHALLMMWLVAWTQVPCGSMPNDESVIRAKCRVPAKNWPALRPILMRGWWLAEDGKLYHATITERVLEMLEYRRKEAERRGRNRGKSPAVPELSRGTEVGHTQDTTGVPDTGTGTGTFSPSLRSGEATAAGEACKAMRAAGMQAVSPSHPKLNALLQAGITIAELTEAAADAVQKGKPFAYALATAEGRRRDAAVEALPAAVAADPDSKSAVEAEAAEKGIGPWSGVEQWSIYLARVRGTPLPKPISFDQLAGLAAQRAGAH